jgi:hypothetical protein
MTWHILKVTLAHVRPAVWRRLAIPSDFTLAEWVGGDFDLERFVLADINRRLARLA